MRLVSFLFRTLLWLWALPLTLLGMPSWFLIWCSAQFSASNKAVAQLNIAQAAPVFIAYGKPASWLLAHHPFGQMDAIAIGCCVFARDAQALQRTLAHELVHVHQALQWGALFPLAYGACSVWACMRGRCPYADNYFEVQANLLSE